MCNNALSGKTSPHCSARHLTVQLAVERGQLLQIERGVKHSLTISKDSQSRFVAVQVYVGAGPEQRFKKGMRIPSGTPEPQIEMPRVDSRVPGERSNYLTQGAQTYLIGGGTAVVHMVQTNGPNYMGILEAYPGARVPEHTHEVSAEMLYVLEGAGEMTVDGQTVPVKAGHMIQVAPGIKHSFSIRKGSQKRFVAVQIYSPFGPEQRFKKGTRVKPKPQGKMQ